jgi:predicted enzyme related to lactoylglutathione lyase
MKVEKIYYMLMAEDMDRAVGFYRDAVGLEVRSTSPGWSELTFGDATVALHVGGTGEQTKTGLGFVVSDIATACREATGGGAKVLSGPEERRSEPIKLASLVDTKGNEFSLTQYVG